MVVTETQYRQRKLDMLVDKYHNDKYDRYYFDGENIIVFVKHLKARDRKNCCNIRGLELKLNDI